MIDTALIAGTVVPARALGGMRESSGVLMLGFGCDDGS